MAFLNEYGVAQLWAAMKERLSGAFNKVDFDVAEAAANLVSGDSIPIAFGKLAKNYTTLTNLINTKLNKSDVLANYTTTATGKALDASLGPVIKSKMDLADTLNEKLRTETFSITYDTSVVTDAGGPSFGYYIPALRLAYINFRLYSTKGLIPNGTANKPFAQVPDKYKPVSGGLSGASRIATSKSDKMQIEGIKIESDGKIKLQNFMAGDVTIYLVEWNLLYRTAQ